jgi:hypothetical protein
MLVTPRLADASSLITSSSPRPSEATPATTATTATPNPIKETMTGNDTIFVQSREATLLLTNRSTAKWVFFDGG